jgi:hypothetical protein
LTASKKIAAAALAAGGLLAGGGIAAALELPDQPEPSVAEEKVADIEAPPSDPQAKAAEHRQNDSAGDDEESIADEASSETEDEGEGERPTDTHGYEVSQLATTTEAEGSAKGEEISTLAKTNGTATSDARAETDDQGKPEDAGSRKATADSNPGTAHTP